MSTQNIDWQELSSWSHYLTAVTVRDQLDAGDPEAARRGLEELIEALSRSERRALRSYLTNLMAHIIKWNSQPERRSRSWIATIYNCRSEIDDLRESTPSITREAIESLWDRCLRSAFRQAEGEMNRDAAVDSLTWAEVFDDDYELDDTNP